MRPFPMSKTTDCLKAPLLTFAHRCALICLRLSQEDADTGSCRSSRRKVKDRSCGHCGVSDPNFIGITRGRGARRKRTRSGIPGGSVCTCAVKSASDHRAFLLNDPVDLSSGITLIRTSHILRGSVRTNSDSSTIAMPGRPRVLTNHRSKKRIASAVIEIMLEAKNRYSAIRSN
jgi:hypothetical protein